MKKYWILLLISFLIAGGIFSYVEPKITLFELDNVQQNFTRIDEIFPSVKVEGGNEIKTYNRAYKNFDKEYLYGDTSGTIEDYLDLTKTSSLNIYKAGDLVYEYYADGFDETTTFTSFSVAKTVVSTLIGTLFDDGLLHPDDFVSEHLEELTSYGYDQVTIREVLEMRTGIQFKEEYDDKKSDIYKIYDDLFIFMKNTDETVSTYPLGDKEFYYASINTQILKMIIEEVSQMPIENYLSEKLWNPLNITDASWLTDNHGEVIAWWGLNMNASSYAKIGHLYLNKGMVDGVRILSEDWLSMATDKNRPLVAADNFQWKYGSQIWLPPTGTDFAAMGVWGQMIYINPEHGTVIVKTAYDDKFKSHELMSIDLFRQLSESSDLQ